MFANFKYIQYVVGKAHNMHIMSPWEVWQTTLIHQRIPHLSNKILFKRSWREGEKIMEKIFTIYVFVHNINICPHKAKSQSCLKEVNTIFVLLISSRTIFYVKSSQIDRFCCTWLVWKMFGFMIVLNWTKSNFIFVLSYWKNVLINCFSR